jgi:hypothetical protein
MKTSENYGKMMVQHGDKCMNRGKRLRVESFKAGRTNAEDVHCGLLVTAIYAEL